MSAQLSIIQVDHPVRQIFLRESHSYTIGRDPSCDICIDDDEISRTHALLEFIDSRWVIRDDNSKNGISVAGIATVESKLSNNTWIGLGSLALRFELLTQEQENQQTNAEQRLRHQTMNGRQRMSDSAADISQVLENLMSSALSVSATDRAFVMLTREDGDLQVVCSQGDQGKPFAQHEFIGSASAVQLALKTRKPVVTCDAAVHQQFGLKASIIASQTRALVCLPMALFGRVLGVIYADSRQPGKVFTDLDVTLLGELAEHAALVVAASQIDEQIDQIDQAGSENLTVERLRERVATQQHRIPDIGRQSTKIRQQPAAGVRWSWIESQL
ncbi:MAG: FHA domain-containing protein [Gammaproteobacteria bacterium]|nr:FHA domain-containing protein [Gammaproteobacteria bacterium]